MRAPDTKPARRGNRGRGRPRAGASAAPSLPSPTHEASPVLDFILHFDANLAEFIARYGALTYAILFVIVFVETGLVVMPLLPGDSLLFTAGAFAGAGHLDIGVISVSLIVAAIAGDSVNYACGRSIGMKVLTWRWRGRQLVNPLYIDKTREFYDRHGNKTIVLARFVPIVRTFAPFVAGVGEMPYRRFMTYNIGGGIAWVVLLAGCGYFFGQLDFVKRHFEKVVLAIVVASVLPIVFEFAKERWGRKA